MPGAMDSAGMQIAPPRQDYPGTTLCAPRGEKPSPGSGAPIRALRPIVTWGLRGTPPRLVESAGPGSEYNSLTNAVVDDLVDVDPLLFRRIWTRFERVAGLSGTAWQQTPGRVEIS